MEKVFVIEWDNGEPYEENYTWIGRKVFKDKKDAVRCLKGVDMALDSIMIDPNSPDSSMEVYLYAGPESKESEGLIAYLCKRELH